MVDFAELDEFIDSPVQTYSSGMYARLGFSLSVHLKPEILLIDDGSSDDSKVVMKKLAAGQPKVKPFFKSNGGVASARNFGLERARGEFVAFCDQDDLWMPAKLSKQVPLFDNRRVGLVYCGTVVQHKSYEKVSKSNLAKKHRGHVFKHLIVENVVPSCAVVARKCLLEEVG